MTECTETTEAMKRLMSEDARLRGEVLATGVILAQLLQSICKTQLNPQGFVTRIMNDAEGAVHELKLAGEVEQESIVKAAAVETIKRYGDQIRSVLPV